MYFLSTIVISEPDNVTVCEGEQDTRLTCVLDSSISSDNVQWYRLIMDTSTTQRVSDVEGSIIIVPIPSQNSFTTRVYIHNARKFFTGYYWVKLSSGIVCNVSLTVATSM